MTSASHKTRAEAVMGMSNADTQRQARRRRTEQIIALISVMRSCRTISAATAACNLDVSETSATSYLRLMLEHGVVTVAHRNRAGSVMAYALHDDTKTISTFIGWLGEQTREAEANVLRRRAADMAVERRVVAAEQVGMKRDPMIEALFGTVEEQRARQAQEAACGT